MQILPKNNTYMPHTVYSSASALSLTILCEPGGVGLMAFTLIMDSPTRSVSEGILGKSEQRKALANAAGYDVSAIGLQPSDSSHP